MNKEHALAQWAIWSSIRHIHSDKEKSAFMAGYESAHPTHNNAERDWKEDSSHENGNYQCICSTCGNTFMGHKRRITCKLCGKNNADSELVGKQKNVGESYLNLIRMKTEHRFQACDFMREGDIGYSIVSEVCVKATEYLKEIHSLAEKGRELSKTALSSADSHTGEVVEQFTKLITTSEVAIGHLMMGISKLKENDLWYKEDKLSLLIIKDVNTAIDEAKAAIAALTLTNNTKMKENV